MKCISDERTNNFLNEFSTIFIRSMQQRSGLCLCSPVEWVILLRFVDSQCHFVLSSPEKNAIRKTIQVKTLATHSRDREREKTCFSQPNDRFKSSATNWLVVNQLVPNENGTEKQKIQTLATPSSPSLFSTFVEEKVEKLSSSHQRPQLVGLVFSCYMN